MDCHVALRAFRNDGTYVIASRRRSNPFPHRHCKRNEALHTTSLRPSTGSGTAQRSNPCHVIASAAKQSIKSFSSYTNISARQ